MYINERYTAVKYNMQDDKRTGGLIARRGAKLHRCIGDKLFPVGGPDIG